MADPTVKLVIKAYPTISNTFNVYGEQTPSNIRNYIGKWYFEGKYIYLIGNEGKFTGETLYYILISFWWIMAAYIVCYYVYNYLSSPKHKQRYSG